MTRAQLKRVSSYVLGLPILLVLVGGLLHTPAGRPLLARLGVGCPIKASPEDIEAGRLGSARVQRGTAAAPSRPALGFELDRISRREVETWAAARHLSCADVRAGLLRCVDVPAAALGEPGPSIERLDFGFSLAEGRLVNLSAWRSGLSSRVAAAHLNEVVARMNAALGAPTRQAGQRSAEYLAGGPLHTAVAQYRFRDYIADVSATNIPGRGLSLREHYMSARD